MTSMPLFNKAEMESAFALILPPADARMSADVWFEVFAEGETDEGGFFCQEPEEPADPEDIPPALAIRLSPAKEREQREHERKYFGSMTLAGRIDFLMHFSGFHLNLLAYASPDARRRIQTFRGSPMEGGMAQMARIVQAFQSTLPEMTRLGGAENADFLRDRKEIRPQVGFRLKADAFESKKFVDALREHVPGYHDMMLFDKEGGEVPGCIRFNWGTAGEVVDSTAAWLRSLPYVLKTNPRYGGAS